MIKDITDTLPIGEQALLPKGMRVYYNDITGYTYYVMPNPFLDALHKDNTVVKGSKESTKWYSEEQAKHLKQIKESNRILEDSLFNDKDTYELIDSNSYKDKYIMGIDPYEDAWDIQLRNRLNYELPNIGEYLISTIQGTLRTNKSGYIDYLIDIERRNRKSSSYSYVMSKNKSNDNK